MGKINKKLMGVGGGGLEEGGRGHLRKSPSPPPPSNPPRILVVAGEASGDDHAARLVAAIRESCPERGVLRHRRRGHGRPGGADSHPRLGAGGGGPLGGGGPPARDLAGPARHRPGPENHAPDLAILVDFPDFNFWVARLAKYYRVPVMYYISPQVWAWRTYRVRTIARLTDRMVVIFPFEAEFYRQRGVAVAYVGHPFRETLPPTDGPAHLFAGA